MARKLTPQQALARAIYHSVEAEAGMSIWLRQWPAASRSVRGAFSRDARKVLRSLNREGFILISVSARNQRGKR